MARVKDVINLFKEIAPEENVVIDDYDNVGLLVGKASSEVSKVLCCLDATEEVVAEATKIGAQMIISHHPMIFAPIKSVTEETVVGRKIITAIENGISIYAAHTNLDFSENGINDFVAELIGLTNVEVMDAYISKYAGLGRVGNLSAPIEVASLKRNVENLFADKYVRLIGEPYETVERVAVINGAGGGDTAYIDMAVRANADCLITADVKHHVAVYAKENGLTLIEPQHYTMEYCYISQLVDRLRDEASLQGLDVEFTQSDLDVNPRT